MAKRKTVISLLIVCTFIAGTLIACAEQGDGYILSNMPCSSCGKNSIFHGCSGELASETESSHEVSGYPGLYCHYTETSYKTIRYCTNVFCSAFGDTWYFASSHLHSRSHSGYPNYCNTSPVTQCTFE